MRGKRGDIDVQFNWVFVFIVGALILAIAVGFVTTQKKNSDTLISYQIVRFTRSVITHAGSTSGKTEFIDLQKELGTTCDQRTCTENGCTSEVYVIPKSLKAYVSTPVEPIFSPSLIEGSQMMTWTMEWGLPFHATNFIFLTGDTARYIFIGDDSVLDTIYSGLPDTMANKEQAQSIASLKNHNNYRVKLIFFGTEPILPAALKSVSDSSLTAVKVEPIQGAEIGKLTFYEKSGSVLVKNPSTDTYYIGKSSLYGAVFAEDYENYVCNMEKTLARLDVVSQLYQEKLNSLLDSSDVSDSCKEQYTLALPLISEITQNLELDKAQQLYDISIQIKEKNTALKTKSCPVIY